MGIFSSDRYQEGFDLGYAHAMAGRPKSYFQAACTVRENGFNSFVEGYKEGYRKGCYDRANKN